MIRINSPKSKSETRQELCDAAIANPELSVTELATRFGMRRDYAYGILKRRGIVRHRVPVYHAGVVIPGIPVQPKEFTDALHRMTLGTATAEDELFADACIATTKERIRARNPHYDPQRSEDDWMPPVVPAPDEERQ